MSQFTTEGGSDGPHALASAGAAITSVRRTTPDAAPMPGVPRGDGETPSGHPRLDSWDVDDGLESEAPVLPGKLLGGRYVVERMFAEGGMGIVCLGRHAQLDQPVAIKFLRRALSGRDAIVQRFLTEARALAALRSEHVVRVMDVGQLESGRPYLVMEHLDGIDLGALVDREGPLGIETAVSYVLQVCEPLAEAHALGIVHRDIKPENLFLWSGGPGKDIVKVLDFGLAKRLGSTPVPGATGPQDSMGSPCYMSPEQIVTPQLVDSRTDIWSLGVVLHQLLTDTMPFNGTTVTEVFGHVLNAAPKPLREILPAAGPELEAIVHRCLEKAPEDRYATMSDLADALTHYLTHHHADIASDPLSEAPILPPATAPSPLEDDTKIRIPGVHARWPGVVVALLMLASAAVYQADRTGRIRLRDLTDGRFTPARLGIVAPPPNPPKSYEPPLGIARGVFAVDPVLDANGSPTIRAEPEPDLHLGDAVGEEAAETEPMTEVERARRQAAYRDYLTSHGLTPLRDVLPKIDAISAPEGADTFGTMSPRM